MKAATIALVSLAFSASIAAVATTARAAEIDLGHLTCKAFLEGNKDDITRTAIWLDGYYKNEDDPAVIDLDKLKENETSLTDYCAKNPTATVGDAAEELFGTK